MDGHDSAGAWGDAARGIGDIEVAIARADIAGDGCRACGRDGLKGGDKGECGHEDFVAGADAAGLQGEVEGGGACGYGGDFASAEVFAEIFFKRLGIRSHTEQAAMEHGRDTAGFSGADG